jgi:hypothetical protein
MQWRAGLCALLILGWLWMLLQLWSGFATFPSAERLEHSRLVAIPTLPGLALLAARSVGELLVVLAILWPWRARAYLLRMLLAAALLTMWFIATTPLSLSTMAWVHRRWLAAMTAGLLITLAAAALVQLVTTLRARHG